MGLENAKNQNTRIVAAAGEVRGDLLGRFGEPTRKRFCTVLENTFQSSKRQKETKVFI